MACLVFQFVCHFHTCHQAGFEHDEPELAVRDGTGKVYQV